MRFKLLVLLIACTPTLLLAQKNVPGFMGKQWNIQYQGFLWPSFYNPNTSEITYYDTDGSSLDIKTSINYEHHLVGAYSFSKKHDLIADVHYTKTNFDPYGGVIYNSRVSGLYYPEMSATGFSLGIRIYKKHFAPIGSYVTYKVGYTTVNVDDLDYTYQEEFGPKQSLTLAGGKISAPTISIGYGINRVIAKKIMLSYGFDFSLFMSGLGNWNSILKPSDGDGIDLGTNSDYNQEVYMKRAAGRYAIQSLFNLKLGIGYLL